MIKGTIKVPIYDCCVKIFIEKRDILLPLINKYLKICEMEPFDLEKDVPADGLFFGDANAVGTYYIFYKKETLCMNTYHHEKCHFVEAVLRDREMSIRGESRAYLDGWMSEKFAKFAKKHKLKLK